VDPADIKTVIQSWCSFSIWCCLIQEFLLER